MFLYRIGFSPSLKSAEHWVTSGLVFVNGKLHKNIWKPIIMYDYVTVDPSLWSYIKLNLTKIFFYGSKASRRRRCISNKLWTVNRESRAHFIGLPEYTFVDLRCFSFYWWKQATPELV
jgi:ribosomal protein S4